MKFIIILCLTLVGCKQNVPVEDAAVWKKVKVDFRKFDNEGLIGPPNGKVSANYEFCIPMSNKLLARVKKIDPTAEKSLGKGRVACSDKEWMIIGSTHQHHFQRVLYELARLPYVREIQETLYE